VGVTAAKAIAWTTGCHLVGVSGFEVIARRTGRLDGWMDTPVAIAYDAGRGEVFAAWAEPAATDAHGWRLAAPCLLPFDDWLGSLPSGSHVSGPAVDAHRERLVAHGGVVCASREACLPFALDTAAIAGLKALAGEFDDPRTLVPDYLRPSYAEEAKPRGSGSPTP
jgi:tRNA A37 threonylcarbamoyladenosine modification protein TsaB